MSGMCFSRHASSLHFTPHHTLHCFSLSFPSVSSFCCCCCSLFLCTLFFRFFHMHAHIHECWRICCCCIYMWLYLFFNLLTCLLIWYFFAPSQPRRHTAAHWRWFRPLYRGATVLRWHYGAVHFHNHCGSLNTRTRTTGIALALTCSSTCTSHYIRLIRSSAVVVDDGDVCCCRQRCSTECSKCVNPTKCDTKLRRRQKAHNV